MNQNTFLSEFRNVVWEMSAIFAGLNVLIHSPLVVWGGNIELWSTMKENDSTQKDHKLNFLITYSPLNKNTLETCKNPRPTSGWSELTKSCTTSTMNFHMAYFSWIPKNNAKFQLSCKFGESKCNPCYHIILTTSHGMDYVLNEHLDFMPTWHICNIISDNIVIQLIWKFQESNWNPDWFIA